MTKISRRQFISAAVTTAASVSLSGCANSPARLTPTPSAPRSNPAPELTTTPPLREADPVVREIVEYLQQELNYLELNQADLITFAREFQVSQGKDRLQNQYQKEREKIENRVVTQFLLSTDFFWNNAAEYKSVKYQTYYDPYNGCSNPFARFD